MFQLINSYVLQSRIIFQDYVFNMCHLQSAQSFLIKQTSMSGNAKFILLRCHRSLQTHAHNSTAVVINVSGGFCVEHGRLKCRPAQAYRFNQQGKLGRIAYVSGVISQYSADTFKVWQIHDPSQPSDRWSVRVIHHIGLHVPNCD